MRYRRLGQSDLTVSTVAMGCWAIADPQLWGRQDESDAIAAIQAALDAGITLFDTAPAYGQGLSERLLGQALGPRRDRAVIATKVGGPMDPGSVQRACEQSLKDLGTDRIDLYQIHWRNRGVPLADTLGAMRRLQEQGKVRAIGVCNFGPLDLREATAAHTPVSNQVSYSLLHRAIEFEIQPRCVEHGVGILCYSPLAHGLLTGKFARAADVPDARARSRHFSSRRAQTRHQGPGCEVETFEAIARIGQVASRLGAPMGDVALAWCLAQPGVCSVLAGARNATQARANAAAAEIVLDAQTLRELDEATAAVKAAIGPHADPWESPANSRIR